MHEVRLHRIEAGPNCLREIAVDLSPRAQAVGEEHLRVNADIAKAFYLCGDEGAVSRVRIGRIHIRNDEHTHRTRAADRSRRKRSSQAAYCRGGLESEEAK